jgi:hypothetical protein
MKKALITGITGQDGAYLAELLLQKGYEVHGVKRRTSLFNTDRIDHLFQGPHERDRRFVLHHGDMTDSSSLTRIIQQVLPDEIYNLAAQSWRPMASCATCTTFPGETPRGRRTTRRRRGGIRPAPPGIRPGAAGMALPRKRPARKCDPLARGLAAE